MRPLSDEQILSVIARERTGEYDAAIAGTDSRELFRHLSSLRHSLLCWYPFRENARILEVGGGFGALTGFLADRAGHLDVVERREIRADGIRKIGRAHV